MEQNNNAANTPVASSSTAQTNVAPVTPQDSPSKVSSPKDDVVFADKPKSNGMLLGMILLGILAVGGIGFGVWTMMDGNSQKEQLNSQISALKQQNEELQKEAIEDISDDDITDSSSSAGVANASDYIYIGKWGLKVKVPENLEIATFMYDYGSGYDALKVSGATKDGQAAPDFASVSKCVLGVVERYSKANVEAGVVPSWYGDPFRSDDSYNYYYVSPQALCTEVESNAKWETNTVDVIKSMLTNSSAYSKI